ncbi:hypothetical protein DFH11DRAFT_1745178 [Phellopilus nigrolimitatus]|nr:hypothetical protein DFH11DRAFT_1745178 [Phellopilus nigrolimitatus]
MSRATVISLLTQRSIQERRAPMAMMDAFSHYFSEDISKNICERNTAEAPKGLVSVVIAYYSFSASNPSRSPIVPLSPSKSQSVRAHLAELLPLPRHALFAVRLTIHQLWNVPLVSGEFSVKWKFQHVQKTRASGGSSNTSSTVLAKANGYGIGRSASLNGKGKGKEREISDRDNDPDHESLVMPSGASMLSIPSTSESSSSSSPSPRTVSIDLPANGNGGGVSNAAGDGSVLSQDARGRTSYIPLREHNVKWGQVVNVAVQMGVQRDTMDLQPSELKLVVEQLSVPGDPYAPQNPQLGAVYLNLAEYVGEGPVTRRYLLRQSKTNATLQLTLELTHIGGETAYKAPPLQKGEVMAGIAALLEKSPYGSLPAYDRTATPPLLRGHRRATDNGSRSHASRAQPALPELGAGGLRTTDNIIEAIFNPVPTTSAAPSPFTYYVPPKPRPKPHPPASLVMTMASSDAGQGSDDGLSSAVSGAASAASFSLSEGRPPSIAPSALSERSQATTASRSSAGASEQPRQKWWQKLGGGASRNHSQPPHPHAHAQTSSSEFAPQSLPKNLASMRSSPGVQRGLEELNLSTDNRSAPQIIVRSPTTKAHSSSSSGSWSYRS